MSDPVTCQRRTGRSREPRSNIRDHHHRYLAKVHTTSSNKSFESVCSSGGRAPACNFTIRASSDSSKWKQTNLFPRKNRCSKPANRKSQSPEDRVVMDQEPSDSVVCNPSKKASRSNLLCPLTDSEFSVASYHQQRKQRRSVSLPKNSKVPTHGMMDALENELLTSPQVSPSASTASTFAHMTLVTQQLEEIRQAQDDVLKHLGEEMVKVTGENERLQQEMDQIR